MTKDGYAQRASELTALIESTVDDILIDLAETENARQALADRERRADELAHADLVACREQLRQESERADREAAEASSLRDEVDRLTRQRDEAIADYPLPHTFPHRSAHLIDRVALDPADPDDLRTVADFLEHYTSLVWKESPNERPEWSAADLRCKAEYLEESDALIERVARVIYETDERDKTPKREWASRSDALRADYLANARALHAAGLLTDGEQQ